MFYPKIVDQKISQKTPPKLRKNRSLNLRNRVPVEAKCWIVKKTIFEKKKNKNLIFDPGKKGSLAAQTLFFTMNSHDFYTLKKCTF